MHIFNSPRLREREQGLTFLRDILRDKSKCFIIHYSCESFVTNHGRTPRVTSICVKSLNTGQTTSFSIHLQAQFDGLDFNSLSDSQYDELEVKMLSEFSDFVNNNRSHKWIHWNMRDSNYGFEAINNRIRILGGNTFVVEDDRKFDFPKILGQIYTYAYEANRPNGRLLNLADRNKISTINALTGALEAEAFDNKEYLKLHMSTLRKVDLIESIVHRVENNELKVNVTAKQIYGLNIPGVIVLVRESPLLLVLVGVLGALISIVIEPVIQRFFHTA
jgi:hypothetical protein